MTLIDTHAHLYFEEFKEDLENVLVSAGKHGISKILMPNIDLSTIESMIRVELEYPTVCSSMLGLHPCYVDFDYKNQLNTMYSWLNKHNFIAIGEVGIDLYHSNKFYKEQVATFETQIEWAKDAGLPLVIHSRNSIFEVVEILKKYQNGNLRGVFHCFSDDRHSADLIVDLGFKLGIGGVITFKNFNSKNVLIHTDIDHIVLETDAPYLAPTPWRGKRNEPSYLLTIAHTLADVKEMSIEAICEKTTKNVKDIFRI